MPKVAIDLKQEIKALSKPDLEKLVTKAASISKEFSEYLLINYINKSDGEQQIFEQAKNDLEILTRKSYKGISAELKLANMFAACNKRITEFGKVCKDKSLELDLIMFVLQIPFSTSTASFGTCFTRYNQQVYLLIKKATTLLTTKLHPDYNIQYAPILNEYLNTLHKTSGHLDYIDKLPISV